MGVGRFGGCCCGHEVCVEAWSIAAVCDDVAAETPPDCTGDLVPHPVAGAVARILRSRPAPEGGQITDEVATGTTDATGRVCIEIPLGIADPVEAPEVDPDGGGATGCQLVADTYEARYSYRNPYDLGTGVTGETLASFPSTPFQVGIPDPAKFPDSKGLGWTDTWDRLGALAVGVYWAKHTYANASGETIAGNPLQFRVGMKEPVGAWDLAGITGGGGLQPGNYNVLVAATDGTSVTTPVDTGFFTQLAGDVYGIVYPPTLPFGCTGWRVWLSPDGGTTWWLYHSNTVPVWEPSYDEDAGAYLIDFSGPIAGDPVAVPSGNDFPVLDPVILLPPDMAARRENATEQRLYLSATSATTGFRRYMTGITADEVALMAAFPASGPAPPTTNTAARPIPRVTFPFGGSSSAVYVKSLTTRNCAYYVATASPKDLSGAANGSRCSNETNTTRGGDYTVTLQPEDSLPAEAFIHVLYGCFEVEVSWGFCNYQIQLNVEDEGGASPQTGNRVNTAMLGTGPGAPVAKRRSKMVAGWYVVGDEDHEVFDASGLSVPKGLWPIEMTACAFYDGEVRTDGQGRCGNGMQTGGQRVHDIHNHIAVRAPGYHDRCIDVLTDCGVPAVVTPVTVDMYSKEDWVQLPCCSECVETPSGVPVPGLVRKRVMASFQGPEGLTGSTGPVSAALTYNPTRSAAHSTPVWDACIGTGGWGLCVIQRSDIICLLFGPDPYDICRDPMVTRPPLVLGKKPYASARLSWEPCPFHEATPVTGPSNGVLYWDNFWNSGCPDTDPPPSCGGEPGMDVRSSAMCAEEVCICGVSVPPEYAGKPFLGGEYSTKSGTTYIAYNGYSHTDTQGSPCDNPTNWAQQQHIVWLPGYRICPTEMDRSLECSGTVTEA